MRRIPLITLALTAGCASLAPARARHELPRLPFAVDSVRAIDLAPGATYHFVHSESGPWAIHVLDVDRSYCWNPVAVRGGASGGALGRERTSAILRRRAGGQPVGRELIGGVNADFFSLATGTPVSAHVESGRLVAGPGERPVFALDSARTPRIATLRTEGTATIGGAAYPIVSWNRLAPRGLAVYDENFGVATDSGTGRIEVQLAGGAPMVVAAVDTTRMGVSISSRGHVLVAGADAPAQLRERLSSLRPGDTVRMSVGVAPFYPMEAVGGFPILVRDSAVAEEVERAGNASFRGRNPRTAVGVGDGGRRLYLVAVDGRQRPYSDGMTLRELASLMLALGASQALNLDGGGSTTLVLADPDSSGMLRVANRPSDRGGERTVGNALAVVKECAGTRPFVP